ncbi:MAG TPA: CHASE2 domain-containing protein [Microcoleaceae cyanobacterium]
MGKLVVLELGDGSFEQGFPVTLEIGEEDAHAAISILGRLPPAPEIPVAYDHWQALYRRLPVPPVRAMGLPKDRQRYSLPEDCHRAAAELRDRMNAWLQADSFRGVREKWLQRLQPSDPVRVIIRGEDYRVQKLPWHLWDLLEDYPNAEVELGGYYDAVTDSNRSPRWSVKILAILGHSQGIDVQADRRVLEQIPDAKVTFLVEPQSKDLTDQLWDTEWDILFFAGHSVSQQTGETGIIYINQHESLGISDLKRSLAMAVKRGLKLAIFNSCDGLGLAREFATLGIPHLIVMREPVADRVAQEFLKYFLDRFSKGESLYLAVRRARERLEGLESQYPCASWLPVIYPNSNQKPPTWQEIKTGKKRPDRHSGAPKTGIRLYQAAAVGFTIALLLAGVRYFGILQPLELMAYDHLLQRRPHERPDADFVVITVTDQDLQLPIQQPQQRRNGKASWSDGALLKVLEKLETYQPALIGLDIYRDYPAKQVDPQLLQRMRQTDRLLAICKVSDHNHPGIKPPPAEVIPEKSRDGRLGFSDFAIDQDGVLRRQLFAMNPPANSPCQASYAFNTLLALRYLAQKGISLKFLNDGREVQLGKARFRFLPEHAGGYQGFDNWGFQLLLNYRASRTPEAIASDPISLTQVLQGELSPSVIKDKIVLIGTTAKTQGFRDYAKSPYRGEQGGYREVPGVVLQAQAISQLIRAALDGRPLLWTLPWWGDALWILGWSLVGSWLALWCQRPWRLGLALVIAIASLYLSCLLGLIYLAGWFPLIPAGFSLVGSAAVVGTAIKFLPPTPKTTR